MSKNGDKQNFLTILGVVLAGVIQISSSTGPFTWWNVIFGVVLSLVLFNYSLPSYPSKREKAALATTWGFIVMSGSGFLFQEIYRWANKTWWRALPEFVPTENGPEAPGGYYFILWIIFSTVAWFVIKFVVKRIREKERRIQMSLEHDESST